MRRFAAEPSSSVTETKSTRRKRFPGRPLVVVIEREEPIGALLRRVLEADGCAVMVSGDAQEAISFLEVRPEAVDLIIADVSEPGIRGKGGLMERLARGTKVLFLSVGTDAPAQAAELGDGAPFLVHRPFRSDALVERIRELLGETRRTKRDESNSKV